jgi:hypothetical protein
MGLGLVDTNVVTVAERLRIGTIATLNRRDFAVVRPLACGGVGAAAVTGRRPPISPDNCSHSSWL